MVTEAEWEYVARSKGADYTYPWGNEGVSCRYASMEEVENEAGCGQRSTLPVCSKEEGSTAQGVCDMAGNVWELVQDDWSPNYIDAPQDGSARCLESSCQGNSNAVVMRGGSWGDMKIEYFQTTYRTPIGPTYQDGSIGGRLARSIR